MTQVYGLLELLRIKCSPLGSAHATAISQCCYAAICPVSIRFMGCVNLVDR